MIINHLFASICFKKLYRFYRFCGKNGSFVLNLMGTPILLFGFSLFSSSFTLKLLGFSTVTFNTPIPLNEMGFYKGNTF